MLQSALWWHRFRIPRPDLLANLLLVEFAVAVAALDAAFDASVGYGVGNYHISGYSADIRVYGCEMCKALGVCAYCALDGVDEWNCRMVDVEDSRKVG